MILPAETYANIMEVMPILCVDIMIRNPDGDYLLIRRSNEPLKGEWWVIGGRVLKGETLAQAAIRKIHEEVGLTVRNLTLFGYYEDTLEMSPFGRPTPQHSVSVVFTADMDSGQMIRLDSQSSEWKFSKTLPDRFQRTMVSAGQECHPEK